MSEQSCGRCRALDVEVEEIKKEISGLRSYCMITFGESHPEHKKCVHEFELDRLRKLCVEMVKAFKDIIEASHPIQYDLAGDTHEVTKKQNIEAMKKVCWEAVTKAKEEGIGE